MNCNRSALQAYREHKRKMEAAKQETVNLIAKEPAVQEAELSRELSKEDWQARVSKKQKQCRDKIPKEWLLPESVTSKLQYPLAENANRLIEMDIPRQSGIMSEKELDITEKYDVASLLAALAESKISAVEVTTAFSKRAAIAQQLTNCLTETYFDQALERANELDAMKAEGKSAGPLHGLPISLKDSFHVKGSEATIGFVSFLDKMSEENSPLVDILLEQGAVIFVKTNIPQTLMTADSENNIFGRTLNPHNTLLGAGGSSGGEGALVGFRGSPIGVGTDIAGSIRIPSLCDGTYGFKPTTSRIPYGGQANPTQPGMKFFLACAGPLANDMQALSIFSKTVIDARPAVYDTTALDVPWREIPAKKTLKLGVISDNSMYPLHPPVRRAMKEAVRLLESQGHEIFHLSEDDSAVIECCEIALAFFGMSAGGPDFITEGGEPAVNSVVKSRMAMGTLPLKFCDDIKDLEGINKLAALNVKRLAVQEHWRKIWRKYQLDAVLSPSAQNTATIHDTFGMPPFTMFVNTLDVSLWLTERPNHADSDISILPVSCPS
jgi:amidase